jgi:DNA topoisomerase-2
MSKIDVEISDFLDTEYKSYANYVLSNRAIASLDGFKPTQRKILYVLNKYSKREKVKVSVLSGMVIAYSQYHHGNTSCDDAIVNMVQNFKNNIPLLEDIGIYGSLRNPHASSPRYIHTRLKPIFDYIYKDNELLEYNIVDGSICEPKFYLPIIPMILVNGSAGIAVGFAMKILNRNPKEVIDACISHLKGKKVPIITPMIGEFNGYWIQDTENHKRWIIKGKFERVNTSTIKITELPPSLTYEKYDDILEKLSDSKMIVSYDDNCKSGIEYVLKFTRDNLASLDDEKLIKLLKLEESQTEIFTTLDETGKLRLFDSAEDIVRYFVDFRLKYYYKRKEFLLAKLNFDKSILANKGKFIKSILDSKLEIKNRKKDEIISDLEKLEFMKVDESYDYLLRMPLWSLTLELFNKLKEDFAKLKEEIKTVEEKDPKEFYMDELLELKSKIK